MTTWTVPSWREHFAALDAANKAAGRCPSCGGAGVVANLRAIDRTGDPHINRRCYTCRGSGKYPALSRQRVAEAAPEPERTEE